MYAKITKDHLWEEGDTLPSRVGVTFGEDGAQNGEVFKFRCYDDDGELYYEGEGDDDSLEPVFDWAMRDAGVTRLDIQLDGEWRTELA